MGVVSSIGVSGTVADGGAFGDGVPVAVGVLHPKANRSKIIRHQVKGWGRREAGKKAWCFMEILW